MVSLGPRFEPGRAVLVAGTLTTRLPHLPDETLTPPIILNVSLIDQSSLNVSLIDQSSLNVSLIDQSSLNVSLSDQSSLNVSLIDQSSLKGQCHDIFELKYFRATNHTRPLKHMLQYVRK